MMHRQFSYPIQAGRDCTVRTFKEHPGQAFGTDEAVQLELSDGSTPHLLSPLAQMSVT